MGKLQEFSIYFTNNSDVFMPGQWITGEVIVDLSDEMKMRSITLEFQGKGQVGWKETERVGEGEDAHEEEEHYKADETYFKQEITVFGRAPPAYMQSVFGANNIRDDDDNEYTRGTLDYAPKYPYYDWSQHPQV
uniref:Arrestin-like N-terminal domain-containing protein n=1 Tax=Branchiostoma floridae TaxID=7739 RepID=C3YKS3_BRAFL|eukprot:XP_002603130.1 hypothetical protein BRAFLDRAFT_63236 [Branchiostoma floridae]